MAVPDFAWYENELRSERERLSAALLRIDDLRELLDMAQAWICGEDCGPGSHRNMCLKLQAGLSQKPEGGAEPKHGAGGNCPRCRQMELEKGEVDQ